MNNSNVVRHVENQKKMADANRARIQGTGWPIFKDLADVGRFVRPVAERTINGVREFVCRVYRDDDRGWRYYGKAVVSAKLLNNDVIGFSEMV